MILLLTQKFDPHADYVVDKCNRRGVPVLRLHTADFPLHASVTGRLLASGWRSDLQYMERQVDLSEVTGIWYRRPTTFEFDPSLTHVERMFCLRESRFALGGLLRSIDCTWMNHPENATTANFKPYQLSVACDVGFRVPRSVITTRPEDLTRFLADVEGQVIYKPMVIPSLERPGEIWTVFTSLVDRQQVEPVLHRLRHAPCLFQEYVEKQVELRITVVGDQMFTAAMHTQEHAATRVDWRSGQQEVDLRHSEYQLPAGVEDQCRAFMSHFGLVYGAIDAIITPDGEFVFLEINESGQWLWVEEELGLPIGDAIIDLLSKRRTDGVGEVLATAHGPLGTTTGTPGGV